MASVKMNVKDVVKALGAIQKGLEDMSPFFKNIGDLEMSQARMRFRDEKDPDGNKWKDSKTIRRDSGGRSGPFTREQSWNYVLKSRFHAVPPGWHWFDRGRGDKVLTDTGTLRNSIGRDFGKDFAVVGTNLEYAERNQEGIGVAKRPFLGVNEKTNKNIQTALKAYLKGLI